MTNHEQRLLDSLVNTAKDSMEDWPPARNKQKKFVLAYVANGFTNGADAAKKAGYSEKTASTVASNMLTGMKKYEHIPVVVDQLKLAYDEKSAELSIASGTEVLQYLTSVMRGEESEAIATSKGLYVDVEVGAKDRIKAAELLGKRHALFTDKQEINANIKTDKLDSILSQLSDDDG